MKDLNHLAIIMDGNARWAKSKNLSVTDGHRRGAEVAFDIIEYLSKTNLKHLSLFAFSSENWKRPSFEINNIIELLDYYLEKQFNKIIELDIQFKFLGDITKLSAELQYKISNLVNVSKTNKGMRLYIAFSYGGRQEILSAVKKSIKNNSNIDEKNFSSYMYVHDMPDVDLLIRTSGERRISNFLLWHIAYAELFFEDKLWPDYTVNDLRNAIDDFFHRKRNFGMRYECL